MGVIAKDNSAAPFIDEWKKSYSEISKDVEEVDISVALSAAALAVKDENELVCILVIQNCAMLITHSEPCEMLQRRASPS